MKFCVTLRYCYGNGPIHTKSVEYSKEMGEAFLKTVSASQGARNPSYLFPIPDSDGKRWCYIPMNTILEVVVDIEE